MVRSGPQCLEGDMGEPQEAAEESGPPSVAADWRLLLPRLREPSKEEDVCRSEEGKCALLSGSLYSDKDQHHTLEVNFEIYFRSNL